MALSANKFNGSDGKPCLIESGLRWRFPVKTSVHIYRGALVAIDADGDLCLAADAADTFPVGVALEQADNSSGADGAISCTVDIGGCIMEFTHTAGSQTNANRGDVVCADGDDAVDLAGGTTNDYQVGTIVGVPSATTVQVKLFDMATIQLANAAIADA